MQISIRWDFSQLPRSSPPHLNTQLSFKNMTAAGLGVCLIKYSIERCKTVDIRKSAYTTEKGIYRVSYRVKLTIASNRISTIKKILYLSRLVKAIHK